MTDQPSQRLGKYQILEEIGRGATAVVYRARDTALDRTVALKVMHPGLFWNPEAVERFLREARAAAQLEHPNIVIIHEVGEDQGSYYIAMQYLPGPNVAELIARGPMPIEQALNIAIQVADALAYAHEQGFIHRDVKPSNIILNAREQPVLTDFGLAKALEWASMTGSTGVVGTSAYIPPEVWEGKKAMPASDVYSLGCVLWEMLAGRTLFEGDTPAAVMRGHLTEPPPPLTEARPAAPEAVAEVVAQALAKSPEERYEDARAFAAALREAVASRGAATVEETAPSEPSPLPEVSKRSSQPALPADRERSRLLLGGLGVLMLLMAALVFGIDRFGRGQTTSVPTRSVAGKSAIATVTQIPVPFTSDAEAAITPEVRAEERTKPTPAPFTPTPASPSCIYTVQAGDTIFAIAKRFGTTVSNVAQANSVTNVNQLYVGQRLLIPNCETPRLGSDCSSFTYVVKAGDTPASIAERFGTTVSAIATTNGLQNVNLLYVGQKLVIPSCNTPTPSKSAQELSLNLTFTARSWIRVALDGETVYEGILTSGDERTWTAKREIALRTGNAGGVTASINGRDLGSLGNYAQVMEYVWRLSDSGQVIMSTPTP